MCQAMTISTKPLYITFKRIDTIPHLIGLAGLPTFIYTPSAHKIEKANPRLSPIQDFSHPTISYIPGHFGPTNLLL